MKKSRSDARCSTCSRSKSDGRGIIICGLDGQPGWIKNPRFDCPRYKYVNAPDPVQGDLFVEKKTQSQSPKLAPDTCAVCGAPAVLRLLGGECRCAACFWKELGA